MIVINNKQFQKLMLPMPHEYSSVEFIKALVDMYGIREMNAHEPKLKTNWDVYFVDDNAELMFKLKYSEYL